MGISGKTGICSGVDRKWLKKKKRLETLPEELRNQNFMMNKEENKRNKTYEWQQAKSRENTKYNTKLSSRITNENRVWWDIDKHWSLCALSSKRFYWFTLPRVPTILEKSEKKSLQSQLSLDVIIRNSKVSAVLLYINMFLPWN